MDSSGPDVLHVGVCHFEEYSLMLAAILLGTPNSSVAWIVGKNGVYLNLVRDVRNAFQADNLVKVDCEKMNTHDLRKIGAKLKVILVFRITLFQ